MVFHQIEKAYSKSLGRDVTAEEYARYRHDNPIFHPVRDLRCVECNCEITLAEGPIREAYFKHAKGDHGHYDCDLYTKGNYSESSEAEIRRKFIQEQDISLNFEIRYISKRWQAIVVIPPFKEDKLIKYGVAGTKIGIIPDRGEAVYLFVDSSTFIPGESKTIALSSIPRNIRFEIRSSDGEITNYTYSCFDGSDSIYTTLINEDFSDAPKIKKTLFDNRTIFDLSEIPQFVVKKAPRHIYCGRHYIFFEKKGSESGFCFLNNVKKSLLSFSPNELFSYDVYDVVFESLSADLEHFLSSKGYYLNEKNEALVIWPPMNSVGNYKYCDKKHDKLFIVFENEKQNLDLFKEDINMLFFRIVNESMTPFYVTCRDEKSSCRPIAYDRQFNTKSCVIGSFPAYLYSRGVLIRRITEKNIQIPPDNFVVSFSTKIQKSFFSNASVSQSVPSRLEDAIRYSQATIPFSKKEYENLKKHYFSNPYILDYLDYCLSNKFIKKSALSIILESEEKE
ncbi:MAG: hypothetical protein LKG11_06070 [Bacilli bacterium]|jgi:hypothetical protein|nr:hypothetical protein [Bacilli bacterium]